MEPLAFLQQVVSPEAKRRTPLVAGDALLVMKGAEEEPLPVEAAAGKLSAVQIVSAGAQVGPSLAAQSTSLFVEPEGDQIVARAPLPKVIGFVFKIWHAESL